MGVSAFRVGFGSFIRSIRMGGPAFWHLGMGVRGGGSYFCPLREIYRGGAEMVGMWGATLLLPFPFVPSCPSLSRNAHPPKSLQYRLGRRHSSLPFHHTISRLFHPYSFPHVSLFFLYPHSFPRITSFPFLPIYPCIYPL